MSITETDVGKPDGLAIDPHTEILKQEYFHLIHVNGHRLGPREVRRLPGVVAQLHFEAFMLLPDAILHRSVFTFALKAEGLSVEGLVMRVTINRAHSRLYHSPKNPVLLHTLEKNDKEGGMKNGDATLTRYAFAAAIPLVLVRHFFRPALGIGWTLFHREFDQSVVAGRFHARFYVPRITILWQTTNNNKVHVLGINKKNFKFFFCFSNFFNFKFFSFFQFFYFILFFLIFQFFNFFNPFLCQIFKYPSVSNEMAMLKRIYRNKEEKRILDVRCKWPPLSRSKRAPLPCIADNNCDQRHKGRSFITFILQYIDSLRVYYFLLYYCVLLKKGC